MSRTASRIAARSVSSSVVGPRLMRNCRWTKRPLSASAAMRSGRSVIAYRPVAKGAGRRDAGHSTSRQRVSIARSGAVSSARPITGIARGSSTKRRSGRSGPAPAPAAWPSRSAHHVSILARITASGTAKPRASAAAAAVANVQPLPW